MVGTFDGLTENEREQIKEKGEKAMAEFDKALKESGMTIVQLFDFMKNKVKIIE